MPRGCDYQTLPEDDDPGGHTEDSYETNPPEIDGASAVEQQSAAAGVASSSAAVEEKHTAAKVKDAGSEKEETAAKHDGELGGLPTTQGVYVGDPVAEVYSSSPAPVVTTLHPGVIPGGRATVSPGNQYAVPHAGGTHHTVIVMDSRGRQYPGWNLGRGYNGLDPGRTYHGWGRGPQPFVCVGCGFSGLSHTFTDPCSNAPILAAACCCLMGLWPCSFIPFLIPDLRDTVHQCPACGLAVGRSHHFR